MTFTDRHQPYTVQVNSEHISLHRLASVDQTLYALIAQALIVTASLSTELSRSGRCTGHLEAPDCSSRSCFTKQTPLPADEVQAHHTAQIARSAGAKKGMDSAMAKVDLGRYRRIVQMFWDPEPTNDTSLDQPVWCLGRSYKLKIKPEVQPTDVTKNQASPDDHNKIPLPAPSQSDSSDVDPNSAVMVSAPNALATPPESTSSSFSSSLAYEEPGQDEGRWPQGFIDDFESRLWMTYRSDFDVIPKSPDPRSASTMSLSMRIKSQLGDQTGYSSDSGWGCMIRSGQSLLANTILSLRLGRGKHVAASSFPRPEMLTRRGRLALRYEPTTRAGDHQTIRGRSPCAILNPQLRKTRRSSMWQVPRGVVWTICDRSLYSVSDRRQHPVELC